MPATPETVSSRETPWTVAEPEPASAPKPAKRPAARPKKKRRDPLLSAICHDLRAPLAAVTMGANFVLQTQKADESSARARRILEAMLRSCKQMERLVRNFADLSEIEADTVVLMTAACEAHEMLEIAAEAARETAGAKKITIELVPLTEPIQTRCDRERLLRAIGHMIDNALKFAPEGSTVTLAATSRDGRVGFAITDRGPGLAPNVRKHLFDRHWHAEQSNHLGGAFGLAIARGVALAHGGRIEVDSNPGSTTFTLSLPPAERVSARRRRR